MPEPSDNLKTLWREQQPMKEVPMTLPANLDNRANQLVAATRSEILMSILAALFFAAVVAWRLSLDPLLGTTLALLGAWTLITLLSLRKRLWLPSTPLSTPGVDFYRAELDRRYKHLRNVWLWYGPLLLACLTLAATVFGGYAYGLRRLRQVVPLLIVLLLWIACSAWQRRRQADAIKRELEELRQQ